MPEKRTASVSEKDVTRPGPEVDPRSSEWLGTLDARQPLRKGWVINAACQIASLAKRYQEIHQALFGFSIKNILHAPQNGDPGVLLALEADLDSIKMELEHVRHSIAEMDLSDQPKRARKVIAIRDALEEYSRTVSEAAQKLKLICKNLRYENEHGLEAATSRLRRHRRDKAAYDASVQEFKRWGARLTNLFEKL